ncbi:hypothetical protein D8674_010400 [Pyrus ussuriensis x Pyrus communis]|uniref:Uncharacterized protein n=1 Tax=Pyrus ussuriensis x Pyrus communis TaxID=2448454 RepID=A0A5N5FAM1_9ROSA|nr:hypothetical protein D8674_010400 [Pyrus ussuriensis x Pyrus communis]
MMASWDSWVEEGLQKLKLPQLIGSIRPIYLHRTQDDTQKPVDEDEFEVHNEIQPWDRPSMEVHILEPTFQKWLNEIPRSEHNNTKLALSYNGYKT